ncbi:Holliday junction branch migration protein RuvA [Lederbergia citri]|uniref:Holliday junction branch migration complex subunit RuvA n=1 Tax=Lederbergia citri TaxID=2833580 RepID=A0A942YFA4_9BACI|nr:Holliday junction branch migration protein RuvA [Lederbergia citri]MBS4194808.1 Holliday junction branch migration protein RuvA [Lederbergia citri]
MYEYIRGTIEYTGPEYVVIENNGIGYQVLTPNPYVFSSKKGIQTIIYTYQHVREDIIALYGFPTMEEKLMFRKLIGVSGIGPKGALAILAFGEPTQVIRAIENEDEKFLVKFPGVGKKTARQMILDLKGKLHDVLADEGTNTPVENMKITSSNNDMSEALEEAMLALSALGYSDRELKRIAPKLQDKELTTDQYIKQSLQMLMT